jgi:outer membrane protein assembly factor BamB
MNQAILDRIAASKPSRPTRDKSRRHNVPALPPLPAAVRRRGPAWLQFAVAAALVLGLLGAAYGGGLIGGSSGKQPKSIPAVLGANNATATATSATEHGPVASFRGNSTNSGQMPGPAPQGTPVLAWRQSVGSNVSAMPAYDNGRIFVVATQNLIGQNNSTYPDSLIALDVKTGAKLWATKMAARQQFPTAPVAANGTVVVITSAGLVGFDELTGAVAWSYSTGADQVNGTAPTVANGIAYISVQDATIRAIDLASGVERWRVFAPVDALQDAAHRFSPPFSLAVSNGAIYGLNGPGLAFALDATDGHVRWKFEAQGMFGSEPVIDGATLYLSTYVIGQQNEMPTGRLYALDASNGKLLWSPKKIGSPFSMAAANSMVFVSNSTVFGSQLLAIDGATGKQAWIGEYSIGDFSPVLASGELFYQGLDGKTKAVNAATGEPIWSVYLNGSTAPIIVDNLLIAASGSTIYAVGGGEGIVASGTPTSIDLSGHSACTPMRSIPIAEVTGQPNHTIDAETQLKDPNGKPSRASGIQLTIWPQLLTANVPPGSPASDEQVAQIKKTLGAMDSCVGMADGSYNIQGFFTDDFFKRGFCHFYQTYGYLVTWLSLRQNQSVDGPLKTIVLGDGRIAVEVSPADDLDGRGEFIIFAEQNGRWLVDEAYRLMDAYNWVEPG